MPKWEKLAPYKNVIEKIAGLLSIDSEELWGRMLKGKDPDQMDRAPDVESLLTFLEGKDLDSKFPFGDAYGDALVFAEISDSIRDKTVLIKKVAELKQKLANHTHVINKISKALKR